MTPLPQVTACDASLTYAGGACLVAASVFSGMLWLIARTACDGARMMFVMPCLSERDEDQASNQNTPLARPLTNAGAVVGDRGDINLYHGTDLDA